LTKVPDDPLARVKAQLGSPASAPARQASRQIAPVPPEAPPPPNHPKRGPPSARWTYRNAAGEVLGYVARFDEPGGKVVLPLTYRDAGGGPRWQWQAFDEPRPLYGLEQLAERPSAPVLVVEGEKAADAARARLPAFVAVTWPGGSKATAKVDWSPLAGRRVVIFPDADEPGQDAARHVARLALAAGAASAAVVALPASLPKGWDLADDWGADFGPAEAEAAIETARQVQTRPRPAAEPGAPAWPPGYRLDGHGLWWEERSDKGDRPQWLSDPFEVVGEGRGSDGRGWAVVVRFRARDGREAVVPISRASLANGGGEVRAALADAGLTFATGQGLREKFTMGLMRVTAGRFVTMVPHTGWHDESFVLPGRIIGRAGAEELIFSGETPSLKYGVGGSLDAWREEVARQGEGNALLTFALSCAFAAPLLRLLGAEGGGFHFRGNSSSGKSTLLVAAGSVWGGDPAGGEHGFGHTWRATTNALETLAKAHNDTLLCLDEFGQVDPAEAGAAAYALANGEGKARLKADGTLRASAKWLLLFLSSGEVSLADHMASGPRAGRVAAGQELRLLDLPADAGHGLGIWESLNGSESPMALSEAVKASAKHHYGHAGPAFLDLLAADLKATTRLAAELADACRTDLGRKGDTGQIARAARRFAVVAAAGELAALWGVVPWSPGAARQAAGALFKQWADAFGRTGLREEREVVRRLCGAIQSQRSMFAPLREADTTDDAAPSEGGRDGEARSINTYGYWQLAGSEQSFLFHTHGWEQVLSGLDPIGAAQMVNRLGFLETDGDSRLKKSVKVRRQKQRVYSVKASILDSELAS
jgi:uncharacterized protein (DUF927 family)